MGSRTIFHGKTLEQIREVTWLSYVSYSINWLLNLDQSQFQLPCCLITLLLAEICRDMSECSELPDTCCHVSSKWEEGKLIKWTGKVVVCGFGTNKHWEALPQDWLMLLLAILSFWFGCLTAYLLHSLSCWVHCSTCRQSFSCRNGCATNGWRIVVTCVSSSTHLSGIGSINPWGFRALSAIFGYFKSILICLACKELTQDSWCLHKVEFKSFGFIWGTPEATARALSRHICRAGTQSSSARPGWVPLCVCDCLYSWCGIMTECSAHSIFRFFGRSSSIQTWTSPWTGSWKALLISHLPAVWFWHLWHSKLLTLRLQDLLQRWLAPYNCLCTCVVRDPDSNLAWNTAADVCYFQCSSSTLLLDFRHCLQLIHGLRGSDASPYWSSRRRATTGAQMSALSTAWAFMQGLIGWSQCMQEIVGRITVNFGDFKEIIGLQLLPYVRSLESGRVLDLVSWLHLVHLNLDNCIPIWLYCISFHNKLNEQLCNDWLFPPLMLPRYHRLIPYIEERERRDQVVSEVMEHMSHLARRLVSLLLLWNQSVFAKSAKVCNLILNRWNHLNMTCLVWMLLWRVSYNYHFVRLQARPKPKSTSVVYVVDDDDEMEEEEEEEEAFGPGPAHVSFLDDDAEWGMAPSTSASGATMISHLS